MSNKILQDLNSAVKNLEEILTMEKTDVHRDAAIKRFELCFDLGWKAIKDYAKKPAPSTLIFSLLYTTAVVYSNAR